MMEISTHSHDKPQEITIQKLLVIFSELKDFLISHPLENIPGILEMYRKLVEFENTITEFYFEHSHELGDIFDEPKTGDDDEYEEQNGKFRNIMVLLQISLYNYEGSNGQIRIKPEEALADSNIFVTVPYKDSVLNGILAQVWEDNTHDASAIAAIIKAFNTYKAQILWEISDITQEKGWQAIRHALIAPLTENMKLLSFDIPKEDSAAENKNDESFETIDSIFDHVFAENPLYEQNIYLGYDKANRRIQTLEEKERIKKSIQKGDESERLQKKDKTQGTELAINFPSLRLLTNLADGFESIVLWHLKNHSAGRLGLDLGLDVLEDERTVAQKRNYVFFKRIMAHVNKMAEQLPAGMLVDQLYNIIRKFTNPYKKIIDKKRYINSFYIPSDPKKKEDQLYSEQIIGKIAFDIIDTPGERIKKDERKSEQFGGIIDSTKQFVRSKRDEEFSKLKERADVFFGEKANLDKILITATVRGYDGESNKGIIANLCMMSFSGTKEEIGERYNNYTEAKEFYSTTQKHILDSIAPEDRIARLYELEKHIQNEHNSTFKYTEKSLQKMFFATLVRRFQGINYRRANIDQKKKQEHGNWFISAHKAFLGLIERLGFSEKILKNAYQQLYCYFKARGFTDIGHFACLLYIRDNLHKNLRLDLEDLRKALQQMYDYQSKTYFTLAIQAGEINPTYLSIAKGFGIELKLRRLRTLEDHYIDMIHQPEKIQPIDFVGDSRWDTSIHDDTSKVEKLLQQKGSLMITERAADIDLRQHNDISPEQWVDIDVVVPIAKNLPKLHFVCRGYRDDKKILTGNYVLSYNSSSHQLELTFDTTLQSHIMIVNQHHIEPSAILGGGYATITKEIEHILLESYMPIKLHEPRIICAVAFKNAFKDILPNAKIIIGDDGMQNEVQYRKDEFGENYKEDEDESGEQHESKEDTHSQSTPHSSSTDNEKDKIFDDIPF